MTSQNDKEMIYVVAGSKREFDYHFKNSRRHRYVYTPEQLAGLHGIRVERIGTYQDSASKEMEAAIRFAELI